MNGKRILIIDDEPAILALMHRQLTRAGYRVDTGGGVDEAEKALNSARYDLVITDVVLTRGTGALVAKLAERICPRTPVLFMSGYVDLLLMNRAHVLEKPYSSQAMQDAIREAIGGGVEQTADFALQEDNTKEHPR